MQSNSLVPSRDRISGFAFQVSPVYPLPAERSGEAEDERSAATMISILAQERLLGAALGGVFVGAVVFQQRMDIYRSISRNIPDRESIEPLNGKKIFSDLPHVWNTAVDGTFGPLITYLSSRGW